METTDSVIIAGSMEETNITQKSTKDSPAKRRRRWKPVRDSLSSRQRKGRPGSRRYKRFMNALFLNASMTAEEMAELDDDQLEELEATLQWQPEYSSYFTEIFKSEDNLRAWEPFIQISEEEQKDLLRLVCGDDSDSENNDDASPAVFKKLDKQLRAEKSFRSLDRNTRDVLKKQHNFSLVEALESCLFKHFITKDSTTEQKEETYFDMIPSPSTLRNSPKKGKKSSSRAEPVETDDQLCLCLKNAMDRRVCHGVCKFYSLVSNSKDARDGTRVTFVSKGKCSLDAVPEVSLSHYLRENYVH